MRARDRLAIIAAGAAFCASALAATALRQSAVEARLRDLLSRELTAPCSFEACTFSVLDGFELQGLTVLDPDDALGPPLLHVDEARFDYNLGLLGGGPRLTSLELFQPELRLVRAEDGSFPLLRVLGAEDSAGTAVPPVRVVRGTLEFGDPSLFAAGHTLVMREINLKLAPRDAGGGKGYFSLDGNARSDLLGPLKFSAELDAAGRRTELAVEFAGAEFAPELADRFRGTPAYVMRDLAAQGTVRGTVRFVLEGKALLAVEGDTTLEDVSLVLTLPERDPDQARPLPVTFTGVNGRVAARDGAIWLMGLAGRVGGAAFRADGSVQVPLSGQASDTAQEMDLTVNVEGLELTPESAAHLPYAVRSVRDAYSLRGMLDAEVGVSGPVALPKVRADVDVSAATASYVGYVDPETGERRGFPWPLTDGSGEVHVDGARVEFTARGRHGEAQVSAEGRLDRLELEGLDTDVTIRGTDVPLDDDIRAGLGDLAATAFDPWNPSGVAATLELRVTRQRPVDGNRSSVDIDIGLDGRAQARPDRFPAELRDLTGRVAITEPIVDGRRVARIEIIDLRGRGEGFALEVNGQVDGRGDRTDERVEIDAVVETLEGAFLDGVLAAPGVSPPTKDALRTLGPRGAATVRLSSERSRDGTATSDETSVAVDLRGVAVLGWTDVPLALEDLRGQVKIAADDLSASSVRGRLLGAAFEARGGIEGLSTDDPKIGLFLTARNVPLDARLRQRLGRLADGAAAAWDKLQPGPDARADVKLEVHPKSGGSDVSLELDDIRGRLDAQGLGLDVRSGRLGYDGRTVDFECDGTLAGGELRVARGAYDPASGRLDATVTARALAVPGCFAALIPESTNQALEEALPGRVLHVPQLGVRWEPSSRTLELNGEVGMRPLERAARGDFGLGAEGTFVLQAFAAHVPADGPVTFEGSARATGVHLQPGVVIEELAGDVTFSGRVGGGAPALHADVSGASFRVLDLPFGDASLVVDVEDGTIRLEDVAATLHGGRLTGRFLTGRELAYRGRVQVTGAEVSRITTAPAGEPNEGLIDLTMRFRNATGRPSDLEGVGRAELREGRILRVPVLTRVARAVNTATLGVTGGGGYFRQGHMDFELDGDLLVVRDLFLEGPETPDPLPGRLELRSGKGAISLEDQRIDMLVAPRFSFGLLSLDPTGLVAGVMDAAQWLVLRQLRVEGTLRNPRTAWQVLPVGADGELQRRPQPAGDLRPLGPHPW